jgi:hypothetical protein
MGQANGSDLERFKRNVDCCLEGCAQTNRGVSAMENEEFCSNRMPLYHAELQWRPASVRFLKGIVSLAKQCKVWS